MANPKQGTETTVLSTGSESTTAFVVDLAFVAGAESGSGDGMAQLAVRLGVHYAGNTSPNGHVDLTDLNCPKRLPATGVHSRITNTITLHG